MTKALMFALAIGLSATATHVAAQDRSTVFVHGLGSDPGTWAPVAGRVESSLQVKSFLANLDWRQPYESQANELDRELGGQLPSDTIAVGHSNGGIVSRQWSRNRPLGALVTLGSPNQGAPFVDHLFDWLGFLDDGLNRIDRVGDIFNHRIDQSKWWWLPAQWTSRFSFVFDIWNTAGQGAFSLGFDYRLPILPEMRVASSYMQGLNSSSNRDREASQIPLRATIVNVAKDFDHGGPFRVLSPQGYETWHDDLAVAGIGLEALSLVIRAVADVRERDAFDLADGVAAVGDWLLDFEEFWCRTVSDPSPIELGHCYENDGIVPAWSQAYDHPRVPVILSLNGPIHTRETAESDGPLFQTFVSLLHVLPRGLTPPASPSNPSGPNPLPIELPPGATVQPAPPPIALPPNSTVDPPAIVLPPDATVAPAPPPIVLSPDATANPVPVGSVVTSAPGLGLIGIVP